MGSKKDWFQKWFDSPYYHVLYRDRDEHEAELFLRNLITKLDLKKGSEILDLACGKGRHSIFLEKQGFTVTGLDISEKSIAFAKKNENPSLSFFVHDMRKPFRINFFDCVLNLFTSFAYFENIKENQQVLQHAKDNLKKGGVFILDFMNASYVIEHLCHEGMKTVEGIDFKIEKKVVDGFILKKISFTDKGNEFTYTERVQAIHFNELKHLVEGAGLKVIHLWGDYELNDFNENTSSRLIIAAIKE